MRTFKYVIILSLILLFSCDDSINGPVGSDLNYEPQFLSVGEEVDFGTIGDDAIKVRLAGSDGNSYILEHSNNLHANCPLHADNLKFDINMWDGKYEVTFLYKSSQENSIMLQLYKFESLQ